MPSPKFYCENCKKEVSSRDKICPHCGRFFSDVRCPRCNFVGKAGEFLNGCPTCGYLRSSNGGFDSGQLEFLNPKTFETPKKNGEKKTLQPWAFLALTLGLSCVLAVLFYLYLRL